MKKARVDEILAAMDKGCKPLGFETFDELFRAGNAELEKRIEANRKLTDRDAVRQALEAAPEMSVENRHKFIYEVTKVAYTLRQLAIVHVKNLPHNPGGRRLLDVHQQSEKICVEISELFRKRVLLRDAYKRVAQRYGVSARTVQRIWNARKSS